jgi:hypothetical protein
MYVGKLVVFNETLHAIIDYQPIDLDDHLYQVNLSSLNVPDPKTKPIFSFRDKVLVEKHKLSTYTDDTPLVSTVGLVIWNYIALAAPFGEVMPYINTSWNRKVIEDLLAHAVITETISTDQLMTCMKNVYYLGHFTELGIVAFTKKSLTTDPEIPKRREQLLRENRDALLAGDAVVMNKIEQELINMDKEWVKDDPVMLFYAKNMGKVFNIQRKKLFATGGMTEKFGDKGNFDFVPSSLSEGWDPEYFDVQASEIRSGSYSRAKETAIGGEDIKFILRVFQNSRILEEDCETTQYLPVHITQINHKFFMYRYMKTSGNNLKELTEDNIKSFIGKTILIRSPMKCKTDGGYCRTCMGKIFSVLDQKQLDLRANILGRYFITSSLKAFHGSSYSTFEISNLNDFMF